MTDKDREKDSFIQFRVDNTTKKQFQDLAKRKAINTSELFRQWIIAFIQEHQIDKK